MSDLPARFCNRLKHSSHISLTLFAVLASGPLLLMSSAQASAQDLGTFGVLAGSAVTNTGPTTINGNVGVSPGTAITGFPPGLVTAPYAIYRNDGVASRAQSDLTTAYNILAGRPFTNDLTGRDLGGQTLAAGVYNFNTSAQLTGNVTLDGQGNPNSVFVFNVASTLTTASGASVLLINGAQARNVYFRVGSSATLGASTVFQGKILALTSITLVTGTTINCGAALARNGAVTLDTNVIGVCPVAAGSVDPDPVVDEGDTPDNSTDLGNAIGDFVGDGGTLPLGFEVLPLLTDEELSNALAQISGEVATGVARVGMQAMDSFLNLVLNDRRGPGVVVMPLGRAPGSTTISALGYAAAPSIVNNGAFTEFDNAQSDMPEIGGWEVWSAGFGGRSFVDGDAESGTHDRSSRDYGLALGLEHQSTADTKFGIALSVGRTSWSLSEELGSGRGNVFQAAVYGRTEIDDAYIAGALGYGYHDISTSRTLTFAGTDHLTADFGAHNVAADIEAGYHLGWLTPYGALRGQIFKTPSYSENTASGNSTFALDYEAQTTLTARTELGARADWSMPLNTGTLDLHSGVAWAHNYWPDTSVQSSFQTLPGASFAIQQAKPDNDTLLLSAGAEYTLDTGFAIAASLEGEFGHNSHSYAGALKLSHRW